MKQMVNTKAPVRQTIEIRFVEGGFVRDYDGKIFYVWVKGHDPVRHIVLEDGTIIGQTNDFPIGSSEVDVVFASDLGISEIKFASEKVKLTHE